MARSINVLGLVMGCLDIYILLRVLYGSAYPTISFDPLILHCQGCKRRKILEAVFNQWLAGRTVPELASSTLALLSLLLVHHM
jgi:hypothetical protein